MNRRIFPLVSIDFSVSRLISRSLLEGDEFFKVPEVIDELSGHRVLAMELVQGVPLDRCVDLNQETRNQVRLCKLRDPIVVAVHSLK